MNAQVLPVNHIQQWKEDMLNSLTQNGRPKPKIKWKDNE